MKALTRKSRIRRRNMRARRWSLPWIVGVSIALSGFVALADQLCFNHVTAPGSPPNWGAPPLIDGSVASGDTRCFNSSSTPPCTGPDLGWTNSFSYIFNNPDGPINPDVTVEGIRDNTHLYLSVQVNNSTPTSGGTSDPNNAVVVAFDPDNTGTKMQWFVISPVPIGGSLGNKQNAQAVDYYWNQNSLTSPNTGASNHALNPSWLNGAAGVSNAPCSTPGTTCIQSDIEGAQWTMELALPLLGSQGDPSKGLIIPPTGHFGMYVDVLRVVNGMWSQAPWPSNASMGGCTTPLVSCQLYNSIPVTSNWGTGTIDPNPSPSCTGISIGSQNLDVYVTNSANPSGSNAIDGSNPNTFHAKVHNTGATVSNVGVAFFIANFGLPSEWQQVAATGLSTIPSGGTTLDSNPWTPPNPSNYAPPNQHQCILATLSANPPNSTYFVNNSAVQNMNFFDASTVERPVQVSSKGYQANPKHNTEQEFDIVVKTAFSTINPCTVGGYAPVAGDQRRSTESQRQTNCNPASQMIQTAEACRHTGMYLLNSSKQPVELCQAVGSFGFVAKHPGTVRKWTYQLTGQGLTRVSDGVYRLRMPNNSVANLNNVVEAETGGCAHLFGTIVPGVLVGGIVVVGFVVYRPRRRAGRT